MIHGFTQTRECLFAPHCRASGSAETGMCKNEAPLDCVSLWPPHYGAIVMARVGGRYVGPRLRL